MRAIPPAYREAVDKALVSSGKQMVRSARALVHVRTGATRASIGYRTEADREGRGRAVVVFAGDDSAWWARILEFDSPYFWPAFRIMRKALNRRIRSASRRAIKKIAGG